MQSKFVCLSLDCIQTSIGLFWSITDANIYNCCRLLKQKERIQLNQLQRKSIRTQTKMLAVTKMDALITFQCFPQGHICQKKIEKN